MRTFIRAHWKAIIAIVLLVLLATVTVNPGAATPAPSLASRLRTHVAALEPGGPDPATRLDDAAAYIDNVLALAGYAVRDRAGGAGAHRIEAAVATPGPGGRAARSFLVGARYDGAIRLDDGPGGMASDAAAVLELARLLKSLHPAAGTEIRFVFLLAPYAGTPVDDDTDGLPQDPGRGGGSFIAFAGTRNAARQVQDTLAAFQAAAEVAVHGLATPAYLQGVTVSDHGRADAPALVITDTAFTRFPYRHAEDDGPPASADLEQRAYAGMARVVSGLARTLAALAAGQRG